jgi:hypothetical protein
MTSPGVLAMYESWAGQDSLSLSETFSLDGTGIRGCSHQPYSWKCQASNSSTHRDHQGHGPQFLTTSMLTAIPSGYHQDFIAPNSPQSALGYRAKHPHPSSYRTSYDVVLNTSSHKPRSESHTLSLHNPLHHDPINYFQRPRTPSTSVFTDISDLAVQHGIPRQLPPPPNIYSRAPDHCDSAITSLPTTDSLPPFPELCSTYLNMLSQKPHTTKPQAESSHSDAAAAQAVIEALRGV